VQIFNEFPLVSEKDFVLSNMKGQNLNAEELPAFTVGSREFRGTAFVGIENRV
jgi:hypothetical protein